MLRPRTYYVLEIESLETGEVGFLIDPQTGEEVRYYKQEEAERACARLQYQLTFSGHSVQVAQREEKKEDKPRRRKKTTMR